MKFAAPAILALAAAGSASAAVTKAPKNACQIIQKAVLINLDLLGCTTVDADILSKYPEVSKKAVCKAFQDGGLVNLEVLGCTSADLDILSGSSTPAKAPSCSAAKTCKVLQEGLLNLNLLGCFSLGLSLGDILNIDLDVSKRGAPKVTTTKKPTSTPTKKACNSDSCSVLQKGGLLNLDLLGCTKVDVDIL
ncbi:hypothetical protein V8E36_006523 [Tilletia maclaganii]